MSDLKRIQDFQRLPRKLAPATTAEVSVFESAREFRVPLADLTAGGGISEEQAVNAVKSAAAGDGSDNFAPLARPSAAPKKLKDLPALPDYWASGDTAGDYSDAFDRWITDLMSSGLAGFVPAGVWAIPNATPRTVSAPLSIFGQDDDLSILDGENTTANKGLLALNHSISIQRLGIRNFPNTQFLFLSDGSLQTVWGGVLAADHPFTHMAVSSFSNATIPRIAIRHTKWDRVRNPLFGYVNDNSKSIGTIVLEDNEVSNAWSGFYLDIFNVGRVVTRSNYIHDIDGSAAGYTTGNNPIVLATGRGINIGRDRQDGDPTYSGVWESYDDRAIGIHDTRTQNSSPPRLQGLQAGGIQSFRAVNPTVESLTVTDTTIDEDVEGIYSKAREIEIINPRCWNAGRVQGAIAFKGATISDPENGRWYAIVRGGHIGSDQPNSGGVWVQRPRVKIEGTEFEGVGTPDNSSAPIATAQSDYGDIEIRNVKLRNIKSAVGLMFRHAGDRTVVDGVTIDGLDGTNDSSANADVIGLKWLPANSKTVTDVSINNIKIKSLTKKGTGKTRIVDLYIPAASSITGSIKNCGSEVALDEGVRIGQGTFDLEIEHNDLSQCTAKVSESGSPTVTYRSARQNRGWLEGSKVWDPGNIVAGGFATTDVTVSGARLGDRVVVIPPAENLNVCVISGQIPSNNTARIIVQNPGGTDKLLTSQTWKVRVERSA